MRRLLQMCGSAVLFAGLLSCAGSGTTGSNRGLVGAMDRVGNPELVPLLPGSTVYRSDPVASRRLVALRDPLRLSIFKTLHNKAEASSVKLVSDERLRQVVTDIARSLAKGEQPRGEAMRFLLAHYGVVEPYPALQVIQVHRDVPIEKLATKIGQSFSLPANSPLVTLGIGISRAMTMMTVVIAVQDKHIDLKPVARKHPAKTQVELRGALLGEFSAPTVYVTNPAGDVDQYRLVVKDRTFLTRVSCNNGDGEYQLEVFGQDAAGPRVLANFPIFCGTNPPTKLARSGGYTPQPNSATSAEKALLAAINRSRKKAGLSPLAIDADLSTVARAHSADMIANNYFAHLSPRTGSPTDRVKAAGFAVPNQLLENISKASSPDEAHRGLMRSPGHRSAILHAEVTRVGIGVAVSKDRATMIATELFR